MVPGSHRWPGDVLENIPGREDQEPVEPRQGKIDQPLYPQSDPLDVHPDERVVEAKAGSVIVFNAHTFHAGRANTTVAAHRRALHCYFVERGQKQQTDQRAQLRPETAARISPLQRYILNVD